LEWNSTCFGQFLCPSSGVFHCTHGNGICHTGLLTACEQDQDGTTVPSWFCSQAVSKTVWHIPLPCVQWEAPDDGQRNCPKHVEFHSKNKLEKLVHMVGFIIRICHDARSHERKIWKITYIYIYIYTYIVTKSLKTLYYMQSFRLYLRKFDTKSISENSYIVTASWWWTVPLF